MKHSSVITSVLTKVELPGKVLEDVINHRTRNQKYNNGSSGLDRHKIAIEMLSVQIPVSGNLEIWITNNFSRRTEKLEVPVQTSFLVTCIKDRNCSYSVDNIMSLS